MIKVIKIVIAIDIIKDIANIYFQVHSVCNSKKYIACKFKKNKLLDDAVNKT